MLRAELDAALERYRRLELRVAELERRLGQDSTNSGTPPSKEPIGAKERRKAGRRQRQESERERRQDRKRGGQPGHRGAGLSRDPDPQERQSADPPAPVLAVRDRAGGRRPAGRSWAQVWDVKISRFVTEHLLPARRCPCCGQVTTADAPPGAHPGSISYGPGINTAAVLLSGYGNVPAERTAHLIGMLLGVPVSPGFVDKAASRLDGRLHDAGFDAAMQAALAAEPALGADETPVNVLTPDEDPDTGEPDGGSPHVLIIRPPGGKLTWLRALGSRRAAAITAILGFFTGFLITDGYTAYQQMLPQARRASSSAPPTSSAAAARSPSSVPAACSPGPATSSRSSGKRIRPPRRPGPGASPPRTRSCWPSSASATTRPSPSASRTTGTGTGTTATTPGMPSAAGCATTPAKSGCSPASPPSTGRTTSPSAAPRPPNGTRPSPGTGTPRRRSPGGAGSAATSTPPAPTASPPSTPSPLPSTANPGCRCPPSEPANHGHP